jgi:hypothetical protein
MALVRPNIYDGFAERRLAGGDILALAEVMPATDTTNTNLTITAAFLLRGIILRNPAGVSNENIDTAANLVAGMMAGLGMTGLEPGVSFRVRWVNQSANALTLVAAANTGLTLTDATVLANGCKDVLFIVVNGTPARTVANVGATNASAVLTGFTDTDIANLSPGMIVLNAVANLQGQTILGVNLAARTVTMSGNANATGLISPQFSPRVNIHGIGSTGAR